MKAARWITRLFRRQVPPVDVCPQAQARELRSAIRQAESVLFELEQLTPSTARYAKAPHASRMRTGLAAVSVTELWAAP
jgi:hypothetical protein